MKSEVKIITTDQNTKMHYLDNKLHREDGPAIEYATGVKEWYLNGKRHREDGPAIELSNCSEWYINDEELTQEEFEARNNHAIIGGVRYNLVKAD